MKDIFSSHYNSTNVIASNGFKCGCYRSKSEMLIGQLAVFYYYLLYGSC